MTFLCYNYKGPAPATCVANPLISKNILNGISGQTPECVPRKNILNSELTYRGLHHFLIIILWAIDRFATGPQVPSTFLRYVKWHHWGATSWINSTGRSYDGLSPNYLLQTVVIQNGLVHSQPFPEQQVQWQYNSLWYQYYGQVYSVSSGHLALLLVTFLAR